MLGCPRTQFHYRRTPTAKQRMIIGERNDIRMAREDGSNALAQLADAFAMNDPYDENPSFTACLEIIGDEIFDLPRLKRMEV